MAPTCWGGTKSHHDSRGILETELTRDESIDEPYVPVRFHSKITELGTFDLWCVGTSTNRRWKLEFSVRENTGAG